MPEPWGANRELNPTRGFGRGPLDRPFHRRFAARGHSPPRRTLAGTGRRNLLRRLRRGLLLDRRFVRGRRVFGTGPVRTLGVLAADLLTLAVAVAARGDRILRRVFGRVGDHV